MGRIIGFKKFTSKKGIDYTVVNVQQDFSAYEKKYGAMGQKVEEVWLTDELAEKVDISTIGKDCKVMYDKIGSQTIVAYFEISK